MEILHRPEVVLNQKWIAYLILSAIAPEVMGFVAMMLWY